MNVINIFVPQGLAVQVSFETLLTNCSESNTIVHSCDCVRFEIYDGPKVNDSALLYRACDLDYVPRLWTSLSNSMLIQFTGKQGQGRETTKYISAVYLSVNASSVYRSCGGEISDLEGSITSPGFPNNYPDLLVCEWIISVTSGLKIQLAVEDIDIEYSTDCSHDVLEIFSGTTVGTIVDGPICGTPGSDHSLTLYGSALVRFSSNWNTTGRGFRVNWTTDCGSTNLIEKQGNFSSPYYPSQYPLNAQCTWTITTDINRVIKLVIADFVLEGPSGYCPYDFVQVFDGTAVIGTFCSVSYPPAITTTGNVLKVFFKSDSTNAFTGFNATYLTYNPLTECPPNYYGKNCTQLCNCSMNTDVCDYVNGTCKCKVGWEGIQCEIDTDECKTGLHNCTAEHSFCINTNGSFQCDCLDGYTISTNNSCTECPLNKYGKGCAQDCSCSINTKSCDNVNGTCTCNIGWEGLQCDADVNECTTNSHNCTDINGICVNIDGSFMCDCKEGFTFNGSNVCTKCPPDYYGYNCIQMCGCSINTLVCDNVNGVCMCTAGWEGTYCDLDIDECTREIHNCTFDHFQCVNTDGSYRCDCVAGYMLSNNGSCTECPSNYYGDNCTQSCLCGTNTNVCDNVDGTCYCKAGWEGTRCELDIDECATRVHNCTGDHAICNNIDGSYRCDCLDGYVLTSNGSCTECPPNFYGNNCTQTCNCSNNTLLCDNINGMCNCQEGWEGVQCETDIDECITGPNNCNYDHVICINTVGSYRCDCLAGYVHYNNASCTECPANTYGKDCAYNCSCSINAKSCDNVNGFCICDSAWEGSRCDVDVNECTRALHTCTDINGLCVNTNGSYRCDCKAGYTMNGLNDCTECPPNYYGDNCTKMCNCSLKNQVCDNVNGTCKCKAGWEGMQCDSDINECTKGLHNCTYDHAICVNTNGSYQCDCLTGYVFYSDGSCLECSPYRYGKNCTQTCSCSINAKSCDNVNGTCLCEAGWKGLQCEVDVNECTTGSHNCTDINGICTNTNGSFRCDCIAGYTLTGSNICTECPPYKYGKDCAQNCSCSINTLSCDKVNGTCKCKAGWEGSQCSTDTNECTTGLHNCTFNNGICVNTNGSYRCDCKVGYTLSGINVCKVFQKWKDADVGCLRFQEVTYNGSPRHSLTRIENIASVTTPAQTGDHIDLPRSRMRKVN